MLKRIKKLMKNQMFRNMESYEISIENLKEKQSNGAIIVDVRSSQEYNEGHIKGAINIPEYEINYDVDKILPDKNAEIILYCSVGSRSRAAYKKLKKMEYKNVYTLYGGLSQWGRRFLMLIF